MIPSNVNKRYFLVLTPSKGLLIASNLSVKYDILYKIDVDNWAPSNYGPSITPSLVNLLYQIWTRVVFDFKEYVSEQVINHAKSHAIKIPIRFIDQKNDIIFVEDKVSVYPSLLTLVISCLRENMSLLLFFLILQILISLI